MKKHLTTILLVLIFLTGLGIFTYPITADQWNRYHQSKAIVRYEEIVQQEYGNDLEEVWEKATVYNATIVENTFSGDAFSQEEKNMRGTEYWNILNVGGNGIMGYVSIPKIDQKLPIYHGTSDSVLQIGVGHMSGTSLPIGEAGTHSVLAGHRGLPSAKLFSDIDQLEEGDKFYIHILDKVFAYEVDRILPMIDKDDNAALTEAMKIEDGENYVTLFTCTPYGINSHRLLVRGKNVPYNGEDDAEKITVESMLESFQNYYMLYIILIIAVVIFTIILIIIIRGIRSVIKAKGAKNEKV
ncbi:MAG: class C sortase [Agathobacter sp.]|nr:class C sortase [Agathobacter sp.]